MTDNLAPIQSIRPLSRQLTPLTSRVLREQVRDAIRDAILSGAFAPGERLGEAETAAALGVSRTPVREAIRELTHEGLLAVVPHRGAVVLGVPTEELAVAYRIKTVLEEEAMSRAASRLTDADLSVLERIVADMAHYVRMKDFQAVNEADLRFHTTVADVANFGLLRHIWKSVDDAGLLVTRQIVQEGKPVRHYLANVVESHRALIAALRTRDPAIAAEAVRSHLVDVQRRYELDLEGTGGD